MKKTACGLLAFFLCVGCVSARAELPETGTRMHRTELEHFTLWSQRELTPSDLYRTRQNLQNVRREAGRAFGGYFPKRKFDVILTQEEIFRAYSQSPKHVRGLFDGTIHLPVAAGSGDARLKAILYHEYTHALLWLASEGKCPSWVHEGFAVDQEESIDPRRTAELASVVQDGRLLWSLKELDARLTPNTKDPYANELAYREAFAVARYLRSRFSSAELLRWVRQMARSGSWDAAAEKVLRVNAGDMEQGTAQFIAGQNRG